MQAECEKKGGKDCPASSKAQCDIHCKESCKVPHSTCEEHCNSCCFGGCQTLTNYDCDFDCFAKLQGGCEVQCQKPEGALFCNGQYVYASDVTACVNYLIEQGLTVQGSGKLTCDANGCDVEGAISACSASPADPVGTGLGAFGFGTLALGMAARTVRRRRTR
ncbi:MAG: hypothetical protein FJ096_20235 [Deltaproteobacteria bacterium]|nr:hypothetical protein [Deltaproteobacteria bacterium]